MTLSLLTINGNQYSSYDTVAEADAILFVDPTRRTRWLGVMDVAGGLTAVDQKGLWLVAATRRLDLLPWAGERTGGATQATAFPRTGLKYEDGTDVPDDAIPTALETATALLAGTIAGDANHAEPLPIAAPSAQELRMLQAGPVRLEYRNRVGRAFPPAPGVGNTPLLGDTTALSYIRQWLQGIGDSGPPVILGDFATGDQADRDRVRW